MTTHVVSDRTDAWYYHGWPWVLILIPFSAVLFGVLMITTALWYPDDVVADDYYKDGMAINRTIAMDTRAAELGISLILVSSDAAGSMFRVAGAKDSAVILKFHHVTDREQDVAMTLLPGEGEHYSADPLPIDLSVANVWYVEAEGVDDLWRVRARVVTPTKRVELHHE